MHNGDSRISVVIKINKKEQCASILSPCPCLNIKTFIDVVDVAVVVDIAVVVVVTVVG